MKRVLVDTLPHPDRPAVLSEEEAHHLIQVLRARNGERVEALDGLGSKIEGELEFIGKGTVRIVGRGTPIRDATLLSLPIRLEMAVLKGDAMEWTVEKAVEIGVRTFIPVLCAHGVVQVDRKGPEFYQERWRKIADQSLKQCGRLDRMEIHAPIDLETLLASKNPRRFWANEGSRREARFLTECLASISETDRMKETSILIGPEGGWSESEKKLLERSDCLPVSLGPWVLRAETAALFAASLVAASMR